MNTGVIPRVTFTQPEVAAVGLQASDCAGTRNRAGTLYHTHLDRAIAEGATSGFTQAITDHVHADASTSRRKSRNTAQEQAV